MVSKSVQRELENARERFENEEYSMAAQLVTNAKADIEDGHYDFSSWEDEFDKYYTDFQREAAKDSPNKDYMGEILDELESIFNQITAEISEDTKADEE